MDCSPWAEPSARRSTISIAWSAPAKLNCWRCPAIREVSIPAARCVIASSNAQLSMFADPGRRGEDTPARVDGVAGLEEDARSARSELQGLTGSTKGDDGRRRAAKSERRGRRPHGDHRLRDVIRTGARSRSCSQSPFFASCRAFSAFRPSIATRRASRRLPSRWWSPGISSTFAFRTTRDTRSRSGSIGCKPE